MMEHIDSQYGNDIVALNAMLHGELAAVESYEHALRHSLTSRVRAELERIRHRHHGAVGSLKSWVGNSFDTPSCSPGAWGLFTRTVTGVAAIAGESLLLTALKQGERHGVATYRTALGNPDHRDGFRYLVGSMLLPQCQEHLAILERLLATDVASPSSI